MPRLPDINSLGERPTPSPSRGVATYRSGAVEDAVGDLGRMATQIAERREAAEQDRQKAQAANALANLSNDLHDIHDAVGRDVAAGAIPTNEAISAYQERANKAKQARVQGLNPFQSGIIENQVVTASGRLKRSLEDVVYKRVQSETESNLVGMSEAFQRAAMRDLPLAIANWDNAVDSIGPQAGWDPAKMTQAKQQFREVATFNAENARLEGAAQTGDIAMVQAARARIEGPDGEPIDPARRTALITKSYAFENGIQAAGVREQEKAQREAEARERKGRDALSDAQALMLNGRYLSTEYLSELATVTAGTSSAAAVQELVKAQAGVAGFATMPLSKQQATIESIRARGSSKGVGTNPAEQKLVDTMQSIHDSGLRAYQENPWQAAQERGVIPNAQAVEMVDISTAQEAIASRMQQIDTVEAAAERKVSPLQPQEAEKVGRIVRSLPPDQQSTALASFGETIKDADRLSSFARQIDAKDKVLGTAMMYANSQTTQGRYVSELILRGERALRDKSITVDNIRETGWRGAIAQEIGDAFPNQEVRDRMIDAAYYIQAGFAAEGSGTDTSRAVRLAAGRIVERGGNKFPLPYGMDESQFESKLESIQPTDLASQAPGGTVRVGKTSVPVDQFIQSLPGAALVHAGQGRYNVRAGVGLVTNERGQRITIEVR